MRDRHDPVAALDHQAAREPSLAKAQLIAQHAGRLRSPATRSSPMVTLPLLLFRN